MKSEQSDERKGMQTLFSIRLNRSEWMELCFAFLVTASTLFLFVRARRYIDKVLLEPEEIPPIFFPRVVLLVIFVLSVLVILRIVVRKSTEFVDLNWNGVRRVLIMLAALLVYVLLFKLLGFIVVTTLLMLFLSWYYGNRSWIKLLALAVAFPPLIYFLFTRLFHILLPRGIL